jgi:hypothetical protein
VGGGEGRRRSGKKIEEEREVNGERGRRTFMGNEIRFYYFKSEFFFAVKRKGCGEKENINLYIYIYINIYFKVRVSEFMDESWSSL